MRIPCVIVLSCSPVFQRRETRATCCFQMRIPCNPRDQHQIVATADEIRDDMVHRCSQRWSKHQFFHLDSRGAMHSLCPFCSMSIIQNGSPVEMVKEALQHLYFTIRTVQKYGFLNINSEKYSIADCAFSLICAILLQSSYKPCSTQIQIAVHR